MTYSKSKHVFFTLLISQLCCVFFHISNCFSQDFPDSLYSIIGEYKLKNNRSEIHVKLQRSLSIPELTTLANQLHKKRTKYKELYILYRLKDSKPPGFIWATTHFIPDLNIRIFGKERYVDAQLSALATDFQCDAIGKWVACEFYEFSTAIYHENNKIWCRNFFRHRTDIVKEVKETLVKGERRFDLVNPDVNNYCIIERDGSLLTVNEGIYIWSTKIP